MLSQKYRATIFAILSISFMPFAISAAIAGSSLEVIDKYFYGEIITNGQSSYKKRSKRIPNIPDRVCFGWVIKVKPRDELAKITEIFTLPAPPENWAGVEDDPYSQTITTNDRKIATTKRFMALGKGEFTLHDNFD